MTVEVPTTAYRSELRRWHQRAVEGEEILVTERGRPVVRVTGVDAPRVRDRLIAQGLLRVGRPRRSSTTIPAVLAPGDSTPAVSAARDGR